MGSTDDVGWCGLLLLISIDVELYEEQSKRLLLVRMSALLYFVGADGDASGVVR